MAIIEVKTAIVRVKTAMVVRLGLPGSNSECGCLHFTFSNLSKDKSDFKIDLERGGLYQVIRVQDVLLMYNYNRPT